MGLTMPTLKVEMAFGANFNTPLASMTWTDVSAFVALEPRARITVGRQDEFNNCDPNDIELTLRNDDGRFSPMSINLADNPTAIAGGSTNELLARFGWTLSYVAGAADGPNGYTSYARFTSGETASATRRGVDWYGNSDLTTPGTSGAWVAQPVTPGETITFATRTRWSKAATVAFRWRFLDGAGNWVGAQVTGTNISVTANTWLEAVQSTVAPAGAVYIVGSLQNVNAVSFVPGDTIDQTGMEVTRSAPPSGSAANATAPSVRAPYFPNVVLYVPIRMTALGGTGGLTADKQIFYGYVDDWPVSWPNEIDLVCEVPITAHSRMARIGSEAALPSDMLSAHAGARGYWPLTEGAGATAALPAVGATAVPMTFLTTGSGSFAFGQDSVTAFDPGTSLLLQNASSGSSLFTGTAVLPDTSGFGLSAWVETTIGSALLAAYAYGLVLSATVNADSTVTATLNAFTGILPTTLATCTTAATSALNGAGHHLAVTVDYASGTSTYTVKVYLDGALAGTATSSSGAVAPTTQTTANLKLQNNNNSTAPYQMKFGHASLWAGGALTAAQVSTLSQAGAGYPGETTSARFARLAQRVGVPAAEISASGATVCDAGYQSGAPLDALRLMETTEGGVIWDRPDTGALELQDRNKRYQAVSAFTLDMALGHVTGFDPVMDGTMLLNDVTVATADNTVSVETQDATSQSRYGLASTQLTTYASDPNEPAMRGQWLVNGYKDPKVRVPSMSADLTLLPQDGVTLASILGAGVGSLFTVSNLPAQMGGGSASYFIEGWTDDIGPNEWTRTWNVSPAAPWLNVLVLDDPVRGLLDSTNVWAY